MKQGRSLDFKSAQEKLFQSALTILSDSELEQVRLHPSANHMHFGLGLYLRNKFVYTDASYFPFEPDSLSDGALHMLIKHCVPEFKEHELIYNEIGSGPLYDAYRYCLEIRGAFPLEEFTKHYDLLVEAREIDMSNPYSLLDDDHLDEWRSWIKKSQAKRQQYELSTLYEIWDFGEIEKDLGSKIARECKKDCLAALRGDQRGFMPSEIAYALEGRADKRALQALSWAVDDSTVAGSLPNAIFNQRGLVSEMVSRRGCLLEHTKRFQDDKQVVLTAVTSDPNAIKFASKRLQHDRRILAAAAANASRNLIFFDEPMSSYNDDDELVGLAIDANGANIAYASERIRGDFNWAMRAISNKQGGYPYGSYENLSHDLKQNKLIALAVAKWNDLPSEFPDPSLADDDELGAALAEHQDHFALLGMSRRIKEKYMTDEELERWGDDPWWWHNEDEEE